MSRTNLFLTCILAILGITLLVLEKPWAPDRFQQASERRGKNIFPSFTSTQAARITIKKGKDEVLLEKRAQGWVLPSLGEYRANEEAVARLLGRISNMTQGDLVTRDAKLHDRYRVGAADAVRVSVLDNAGKVVADFYQGKPQFDADPAGGAPKTLSALDVYIRAVDSNDVFRISPFEPLEPVRALEWVPRNLFRFEPTAVQTLLLTGGDLKEPIALSREGSGSWSLEVGPNQRVPANRENCETLARSFSSLYLQDLVGPYAPGDAARFGFAQPRLQGVVTLAGGGQHDFLVGNDLAGDTAYALSSSQKNMVVAVLKNALDSLKISREKLLEPAESHPADSHPAPANK